uniref:ATP synthase complex subunit 8 n=1 Tax=Schizonycha sp. SCH01 TaxID=1205579 RepID=A0A0S2MNF9_9SCAR|nr:ATP synthase F0 subunit 8 [Schizonycha sp. SCH01]
MPQMAPLNWLSLFMMFCMILMIFSSTNYWIYLHNPKMKTYMKSTFLINWKW